MGYQVVFRMNSPEDAKVLSEMIGDFTRKKISKSQGNLDFVKHNNSISHEGYKLVTVQDILSNPIDQIYILIGGFFNRPIKAKVNFWFKNPEWQGADKIPLQKQSENEQNAQNEENQNQENQVSNASEETSSNTGENNIEENEQEEKEIPYNPFRIYKEKPNT